MSFVGDLIYGRLFSVVVITFCLISQQRCMEIVHLLLNVSTFFAYSAEHPDKICIYVILHNLATSEGENKFFSKGLPSKL